MKFYKFLVRVKETALYEYEFDHAMSPKEALEEIKNGNFEARDLVEVEDSSALEVESIDAN